MENAKCGVADRHQNVSKQYGSLNFLQHQEWCLVYLNILPSDCCIDGQMEETEWNVVRRGYVDYVAVWKGHEKEQELGHDNICHRQIASAPVNVVAV